MKPIFLTSLWLLAICFRPVDSQAESALFQGRVLDAETQSLLEARVYCQSLDTGEWYHVESATPEGSVVPYRVQRSVTSFEIHTSVSAHPFQVNLPAPGAYRIRIERGKEYLPLEEDIALTAQGGKRTFALKRFIDMNGLGWFSGDTHVHRKVSEMPVAMLAEDLNVTLPLTGWVTDTREIPSRANRNREPVPKAELIQIDSTHVIWPMNTEYEIFTVEGKRHTLGAFFVLNHKTSLEMSAPPVRPIALEARRQGGLLEFDKHNWPWSPMLLPIMNVDLFELSNNHLWRTEFLFGDWYAEYAPAYQNLPMVDGRFTEEAWMLYGFRTYYAFLNCGFSMRPTGGTASGVHPVPVGFGRVYCHVEGEFSFEKWMQSLDAGRSFVTTGPLLRATFGGHLPGGRVSRSESQPGSIEVAAVVDAATPDVRLEWIVNGEVVESDNTQGCPTGNGGFRREVSRSLPLEGSSWMAVRAFERLEGGRERFAHSGVMYVDIPGKPLHPKLPEVNHFIRRLQDELSRHKEVLPEPALQEYREALSHFESLKEQARP